MKMEARVPEIRIHSPSSLANRRAISPTNGSNGANESGQSRVPWTDTFHQRTINLASFPTSAPVYRATYRSQSNTINRAKMGCITNTTKSLNVLRVALQRSLNKEIHEVIQKYLDNFFQPAVENIKQNNGANSVSEHHLQTVCQKILEEAKKMYFVGLFTRCQSPGSNHVANGGHGSGTQGNWDSDNENNLLRVPAKAKRPRQGSDSDSEDGVDIGHAATKPSAPHAHKVKRKRKASPALASAGRISHHPVKQPADNVRRDGHRWNPERLTTETKFVLGSKANKALGFGMTRGRMYTKHPDLFRYIGDQEDKQWLSERGLMPPAGGRAYLLLKEDIEDLIETDEYKDVPGVNASDMGKGFTVPDRMVNKMKLLMEGQRDKTPSPPELGTTASKPNSVASSNSNQPSEGNNRPESGCGVSSLDDLELHSNELSAATFSPSNLATMSPIASDISSSLLSSTDH